MNEIINESVVDKIGFVQKYQDMKTARKTEAKINKFKN